MEPMEAEPQIVVSALRDGRETSPCQVGFGDRDYDDDYDHDDHDSDLDDDDHDGDNRDHDGDDGRSTS